MWKHKKLEGFLGFKLRAALKQEPWTLMVGVPQEQLARERVEDILKILDQKYGIDRKQQNMRCLDDFSG